MREMRRAPLALLFLVPLLPSNVSAQYNVLNDVQGSTGGTAGGSHIVWFTAGELQVHSMAGTARAVHPGFWQIAGLTSAVEVAIASFSGSLKHGAVELAWTSTSTGPLDGFNIYRGDGDNPERFEKLNESLVGRHGDNLYTDESALPGRTYAYQVGGVQGEREFLSFVITLSVPAIPLTLYQNHPNPFNPSTSISFYLPDPGRVVLEIYDVKGRRIRTLADRHYDGGRHTVHWNGSNDSGSAVASGIYFYRIVSGKKSLTRKLVMMR